MRRVSLVYWLELAFQAYQLALDVVRLTEQPTNVWFLLRVLVRKAAQMAQHLHVPILGLVENMSYFVCPDTGQKIEIFGPSHAEETAQHLGIPFLGRLPINPQIARLCDEGAIEDYPGEDFAPIVERLLQAIPLACKSPARAT
jgi:hypothetical protein